MCLYPDSSQAHSHRFATLSSQTRSGLYEGRRLAGLCGICQVREKDDIAVETDVVQWVADNEGVGCRDVRDWGAVVFLMENVCQFVDCCVSLFGL